ncbi:hypothetical protein GQ53DRAFT_860052 [Thozetella sp. PMI_491]|nr:hypothetical protein GQ53DRAFT_860052 [Thozetella sp. PMI_491]
MRLTAFAPFLPLILGGIAVPVELNVKSYDLCKSDKKVAFFVMWTTECYVGSGRTLGMQAAFEWSSGLCFPLPDDTHAIELIEIAEGCHLQTFNGPTCNDYPNNRLFQLQPGCLWTGSSIFRSYTVTCDNKTIDELVDNVGVPISK